MSAKQIIKAISVSVVAITASFNASAANTEAMWPGTAYNQQIPTFKQVLGYDVGERITNYNDMRRSVSYTHLTLPTILRV